MSLQIYDGDGYRKYLTETEFRRFLRAVETVPIEQKAFCLLIAYTGCRITESLTARRPNIERGTIRLATLKRRKRVFRNLQIPEPLSRLLLTLPANESDPERLWMVNRSTGYRWIRRIMERADIDGIHACSRGLRHGFAMRAAGERTPPNLIQRWLGHARPTTTAVYLDAVGMEDRAFAARTW